jgi:hypothetical protein
LAVGVVVEISTWIGVAVDISTWIGAAVGAAKTTVRFTIKTDY